MDAPALHSLELFLFLFHPVVLYKHVIVGS